jgi:hypothetical protein
LATSTKADTQRVPGGLIPEFNYQRSSFGEQATR